jgi:hypothetical protein
MRLSIAGSPGPPRNLGVLSLSDGVGPIEEMDNTHTVMNAIEHNVRRCGYKTALAMQCHRFNLHKILHQLHIMC